MVEGLQDLSLDPDQGDDFVTIGSNSPRVPRYKDIENLKDEPIVLFGEGNFSFSMALATLRGGWDGIISTRYEPMSDMCKPTTSFSEVKLLTIKYAIENGKGKKETDSSIMERVTKVLELEQPSKFVWRYGIDATDIPDNLDVKGKVVWFQCPWKPNKGGTAKLVKSFCKCMASRQSQGDYLLIGIANCSDYTPSYGDFENINYYELQGFDDSLIGDILRYGYKHEGLKNIHYYILHCHITLIFKKKKTSRTDT